MHLQPESGNLIGLIWLATPAACCATATGWAEVSEAGKVPVNGAGVTVVIGTVEAPGIEPVPVDAGTTDVVPGGGEPPGGGPGGGPDGACRSKMTLILSIAV